jgi:hypothetical protein
VKITCIEITEETPNSEQISGDIDSESDDRSQIFPYEDESQIFPYEDEIFYPPGKSHRRLTRKQRRELNREWTQQTDLLSHGHLIEQHNADQELQKWRSQEKAERVTTVQGVLCRKWKPGTSEEVTQIVLPKSQRCQVLKLAHDVPMAGHMGQERSLRRIRRRFWWPGLERDVKQYIRSCPRCQKVARKEQRAPMVEMPIIGTPFERIAMDMVGPLPISITGKQYVLVICDYFTRYPSAYALKRTSAPQVAEKLLEFFADHGVPKEILTDKGSNFTSALLEELYKMMGV